MNLRTVIFLATALAVLVALAFVGSRQAGNDATTAELFVPALQDQLNNIERIEVRGAANVLLATIQRQDDLWTVAEKGSYRADVGIIREALSELASARIIEAKTSNPNLHDRLGVESLDSAEAAGTQLVLAGPGVDLPSIILGDSEGNDYRYARLDADSQSYLIDSNPEVPRDPAQWVVPQILDVRGNRIESVTINHADGETLELYKSEVEQANFSVDNVPDGRELQYPGVANVIGNSLRDLRLEDVAAAEQSDVEPDTVTTFETFDGLIVRIESRRIDDQDWLTFVASADLELGPISDNESEDESNAADLDPVAESESINGNVMGWRYRLPSYQHDQLTRRMNDLLAAEADSETP